MSKTYCCGCDEEISEHETRWGFENPYCEECFHNRFIFCHRCDELTDRDDARFRSDGEAYCSDCFDEECDENSPVNPEVYNADREHIIDLSRMWLMGTQSRKTPLYINRRDFLLKAIRDQVGLVEHPVYLFGIKDREEYQISASPNLIDQVREFLMINGLSWKLTEGIGCNRIGLSLNIRSAELASAIKLIKHLTKTRVPLSA